MGICTRLTKQTGFCGRSAPKACGPLAGFDRQDGTHDGEDGRKACGPVAECDIQTKRPALSAKTTGDTNHAGTTSHY